VNGLDKEISHGYNKKAYKEEERSVLTCRRMCLAVLIENPDFKGIFSCGEFFSALNFWRCFNIAAKEMTINEKIRADEVRVIDSDGSQLGVMKTGRALEIAYEKGLDLVEMNSGGQTPVCKIMDYGKYRFDRSKKEKESRKKQVTVETKEIKFSCRIGQHDFDTKISHATRFLAAGNKVKMTIMFSGREMNNTQRGVDLMGQIAKAVEEIGTVEKKPHLEGRFMTMFVVPKKNK